MNLTHRPNTEPLHMTVEQQLSQVTNFAVECAALKPEADFFAFVAKKLQAITGVLATTISEYDPNTQELIIKHITLPSSRTSIVNTILGENIVGLRIPVTPEQYQEIVQEIVSAPQTLTEITFNSIPHPIASTMENVFNVGHLVALSLQHSNKLMGTAILIMTKDSPAPPSDMLHAFAHIAAISLQRKTAQEALLKSEERLNMALDAANEGLWDWNLQTNEVYFSPRYYTMLGYEPHEMPPVYETWYNLIHPEERQDIATQIQKNIEQNVKDYALEFRMQTKSKGWRWILARGQITEWTPNGRPLRMIGTHIDITKRKEAILALSKSEYEKAVILNSISELVIHQNAEMRILWANKAAIDAATISTQGIVGKHCYEIWQCSEEPCPKCPVKKAIETGTPQKGEIETQDGQVWFVQGHPILNAEGEVVSVVELAQNITERVKAAEKLEATVKQRTAELKQAMEEARVAANVKSQFVTNVSHELRTPLASTRLYLELLGRAPKGKSKQYIEALKRETERLQYLIESLLQISLLNNGKEQPKQVPININTIVTTLVEDRRELIENHDLNLIVEAMPNLPQIKANQQQIEQVITNLLTNAINYTLPGGEIKLKTGIKGPEQRWVTITIQDTGLGIDRDEQKNLFKRFQRGNASQQLNIPGVGLGLAISKEIVEQHNGKITVESKAGKGSSFTVWLPTYIL